MSLVHPAQQMYLRGPSIEIDRLSPLLIVPPFRAGLAAGNIVVPHSAEFGVDVVEDLLWLPRQTEGSTTLSPTQI